MQSLQNQFVKAVAVHGVHIIAPYVKFITCIHSLCNCQNYLQCKPKQLITAVRTLLKTKVKQVTMLPYGGIMGNGMTLLLKA